MKIEIADELLAKVTTTAKLNDFVEDAIIHYISHFTFKESFKSGINKADYGQDHFVDPEREN